MATTYGVCPNCGALNRVETAKALEEQAVCGKCQTTLPFHGLVCEVSGAGMDKVAAKSELPVLVDFWAPWCGPCRMYGPVFQELSVEKAGQAVFLKVNTDENPNMGARFGFRGIPTTLMFRGGQVAQSQSGVMSKAQLTQWIGG